MMMNIPCEPEKKEPVRTKKDITKDGLSERKPLRDMWEGVASGEVRSTFREGCRKW